MLHSLGFEPGASKLLLLNPNSPKIRVFFQIFSFGGIRVQYVVNERSRVRFPPGATFLFHVRKIAIFSYCALPFRSGKKHDSLGEIVGSKVVCCDALLPAHLKSVILDPEPPSVVTEQGRFRCRFIRSVR